MKKLLLTLATVLASVAMNAQESPVSLYGIIPETSDLKNIQIEVYMNNTGDITYMESTYYLPNNLKTFVMNEDDEYAVLSERATSKHRIDMEAYKTDGSNGFYVCALSPNKKPFKDNEGVVYTLTFDGSSLADGDYVVEVKNPLAGNTNVEGNPVDYPLEDYQIPFSIVDGKVENTAVGIHSVAIAVKKDGKVFDMMGREVKAASKGLYIINGKKVYIK